MQNTKQISLGAGITYHPDTINQSWSKIWNCRYILNRLFCHNQDVALSQLVKLYDTVLYDYVIYKLCCCTEWYRYYHNAVHGGSGTTLLYTMVDILQHYNNTVLYTMLLPRCYMQWYRYYGASQSDTDTITPRKMVQVLHCCTQWSICYSTTTMVNIQQCYTQCYYYGATRSDTDTTVLRRVIQKL